jgi:hypothetical protein
VTVLSFGTSIALVTVLAGLPLRQRPAAQPASKGETFDVTASAAAGPAAAGTITAPIVIQVDRYTPAYARTTMTDALKYRGYPGFLQALREAPRAGTLSVGDQIFVIRWARQEPAGAGRTISIVTDKPVHFVGAGRPGARSTAGYEVAVVQLMLDASGHGSGTLAAAARVKPRGTTGVQIDDYAETPVKLTAVARPRT